MYAELRRTCKKCGENKPMNMFYYKTLNKEGRCKPCVSDMRKTSYRNTRDQVITRVTKYRRENPEKIRGTKLKQEYGLSIERYNAMLASQDHVCAGCLKPESTIWRGRVLSLAVDHDHLNGDIRGLLCMRCNRALGMLGEDLDTMRRLIDYVEKSKK